jgi:predicted ribosomally synthesized peptide with SipW-like signal peptide
MSNTKTTKRALLSSVIAMFICVAMLIGTTFAWFTDSASTAVNKIQAGTLDVQLLDESGASVEGQTLKWKTADNRAQSEILWEPGCTYELQPVQIKNNGNLALKYKIVISGIQGDAKLNEAIEWTINDTALDADHPLAAGASNTLTISGHMKEDAGNEYQGKSIDGIGITVVATQYTYENDSNGNTYDQGAEYPVVVADETELKQALAAGKDVRLGSDIALTSAVTFSGDVEVVGDGNSIISSKEVYVAPTANVNFKNVNFANPVWDNNKASSVYASKLEGKVVFDGCTFTNPQWECIQITPMDGAEVIVTNCTFVVDGTVTYAQVGGTKVERMLHIQNTAASGKYTAVITNNKFIGVDLCRNAVIDVDDIEAFANVTCGGNTFYNHDNTPVSTMADGMIYVNINGMYDAANVATDTYAQFTQTPAAALHH